MSDAHFPFHGHDKGLVIDGPDTGFRETAMTPAQLAAREPALAIAKDIYRHANYAGVCYIELWEIIAKAIQGVLDASGRKCTHCNGKGYGPVCCGQPVQDDVGEYCCNNPDVDACLTCNGEGTITTIEQYIKTLPADWHQDSSLEKWFPLTAQELKLQRERIESLQEPQS